MKLYLVRHAHAVSDSEDPTRPLSAKGFTVARDLTKWLREQTVIDVAEVWHSPLVRARQTAEIMIDGLRLKAKLREVPGLLPEDPPATTSLALQKARDSLMVVGHEPHLSGLAAQLVGIDLAKGGVEFKKSAVLCLERVMVGAPWIIAWLLPPKLVLEEE